MTKCRKLIYTNVEYNSILQVLNVNYTLNCLINLKSCSLVHISSPFFFRIFLHFFFLIKKKKRTVPAVLVLLYNTPHH